MNKQNSKTVAVVTSTIGRPELALAIKSVQNQTYPCKALCICRWQYFLG